MCSGCVYCTLQWYRLREVALPEWGPIILRRVKKSAVRKVLFADTSDKQMRRTEKGLSAVWLCEGGGGGEQLISHVRTVRGALREQQQMNE